MGSIGWIFQENCYFCCRKVNKPKVMTRETTRRRISAWVLLAIFVLILIVSSLHIHQSGTAVDDSSIECVHNHCGGHLNQQTVSLHDCVLCQFLTLPLLLASVISLFLFGDSMLVCASTMPIPTSTATTIGISLPLMARTSLPNGRLTAIAISTASHGRQE